MTNQGRLNEKLRYLTLGVPQEGDGPNVIDKPDPNNKNIEVDTTFKRSRKYFKNKGKA